MYIIYLYIYILLIIYPDNMLPSGFIKHGNMENPLTEWRVE